MVNIYSEELRRLIQSFMKKTVVYTVVANENILITVIALKIQYFVFFLIHFKV